MTITDDCVQLYMYRQTPINIVPVLVAGACYLLAEAVILSGELDAYCSLTTPAH